MRASAPHVSLAAMLCAASALATHGDGFEQRATIGSSEKLRGHYERWSETVAASDVVTLPLAWNRGRATRHSAGWGQANFDLEAAKAQVEVHGLAGTSFVDVWLIEHANASGLDCDAESSALQHHLGTIGLQDGQGSLSTSLARLEDFELEQVVVAPTGTHPAEAGLLFGTPGLFERMQSAERNGSAAGTSPIGGLRLGPSAPSANATVGAGPSVGAGGHVFDDLEQLVARGEDLFLNETFAGNGRTCATCHPPANNFTIDVPFMNSLPANDPLFVAEGDPFLDSTLNGGLVFENPTLMRQFGLIVENLDGFGDLTSRFVMRSVSHTLGMANSITRQTNGPVVPGQATGWGSDGAPGAGNLRDFATGAVTQHFPKTLGRVPGTDFRLPTPGELNALEAFQLSLGRPDTPDITQWTFIDPVAEDGKSQFVVGGNCVNCHFNAGAGALTLPPFGVQNLNAITAVENFTQNHPDGTGQPRPVDGGFGVTPSGGFGVPVANADGSFGSGAFNAQSLFEVADTLPAFHSNATLIPGSPLPNTVEGAVAFYMTPEFQASPPASNFTPLDQAIIDRMGRFLRALNAVENGRSATEYAQRAEQDLNSPSPDLARVTTLADLAQHECEDAVQVLSPVGLNPGAQQDFQDARNLLLQAMSGTAASRLAQVQQALALLASARADLINEP